MSLLFALTLTPIPAPMSLCDEIRIELVNYGRLTQREVEEIVSRCETLYG